ncbi:N-acetylneuraminate lyase isoform X2 [Copidosoma floridanum]|uniref:N-acetylneuraminate lyase isoform X2 n=1 Tax=Copidosoma floridanum TaxID=29053 RepID=UPI000C6F501E|nr:N-acetylneuraminate lyase isoform X2 [Copidosoma floridanum]
MSISEKVNFTYRGLIVPVFSPFNNDANRSLNLSLIPEYAKFLASKNVTGILVNGTTGEGTSLSIAERKRVAEVWAGAVKKTKQHLMIQVGGASLADVKELVELYFKPATVEKLTEYLRAVGECAPKTPLLYYHIPSQTSVNVHMGRFLEYVGDKIPNFAGIKFTSNDLDEAYQALTANGRFAVFLGSDVTMSAGCTLGINSFIMTSLNFIPEPALELLEFEKGNRDLRAARKNQEFIIKTVKEVTRYGTWVETMKIAMSLTTKFFMGPPRAPLALLSREDVEAMAGKLIEVGLTVNKTEVLKMY